MNMQAVGTYIKTLRLAHELTAHEVGITAGTNATYVWRVENNQLKSPGMDLIMRIVAAVRGRGNDILELMVAENPTDDYARALAKQAQLTTEEIEQAGHFFASDEDTRALLESIYEMSYNKELRAQIQGYVDAIKGRAAAPPSEPPQKTSRRRRSAK